MLRYGWGWDQVGPWLRHDFSCRGRGSRGGVVTWLGRHDTEAAEQLDLVLRHGISVSTQGSDLAWYPMGRDLVFMSRPGLELGKGKGCCD